jgi:hypothetical protein
MAWTQAYENLIPFVSAPTKVLQEREKPSAIPSPNECVLVDIKQGSKQPTSDVKTISENDGNVSSNTNISLLSFALTPNVSAAGTTLKLLKDGEIPPTIPSPSECALDYIEEATNQPSSTVSMEHKNSGNVPSNSNNSTLNNRAPIRRKKTPINRGSDFLWE